MAIAVTIETDIARPPDAVFAALTDLAAWPAWLIATGIVGIKRVGDGPPTDGEQLTIDQRAGGRSSTVEATVTAVEAPYRFAIHGRDADGVKTSLDAALAPIDGGTRLRWSVRIEVPFRYRIFESMVAPQVQRAATLDVEAFKRRLESAPPG